METWRLLLLTLVLTLDYTTSSDLKIVKKPVAVMTEAEEIELARQRARRANDVIKAKTAAGLEAGKKRQKAYYDSLGK